MAPPGPAGGRRRARAGYPSVTEPDPLAELVQAARDGDHAAFEALVRATYADAFTLASRILGDEEEALDAVQEAYLRAFRSLGRFRGDARFSTWLHRIVANCSATGAARRGRHRHEPLDDATAAVADDHLDRDPERKAAASSERAAVLAALAWLPERLRVVVVLRDVYDLPHEAIAAELGITETAAKVRLHRARKKLRARLFPLRDEGRPAEDLEPAAEVGPAEGLGAVAGAG